MTIEEINHEIEQLEPAEINTRNVQVLANLYTIRDNLNVPCSADRFPQMNGSELNRAISGKGIGDVLEVFNELMDTLQMMAPKLYEATLQRLM